MKRQLTDHNQSVTEKGVSLITRVTLNVYFSFGSFLWTSSSKVEKKMGEEGDPLLCMVQTVTCVRWPSRATQSCRVWLCSNKTDSCFEQLLSHTVAGMLTITCIAHIDVLSLSECVSVCMFVYIPSFLYVIHVSCMFFFVGLIYLF